LANGQFMPRFLGKAAGAGTAEKVAIKVVIGVVTRAGWIAAAYTWATGRRLPDLIPFPIAAGSDAGASSSICSAGSVSV